MKKLVYTGIVTPNATLSLFKGVDESDSIIKLSASADLDGLKTKTLASPTKAYPIEYSNNIGEVWASNNRQNCYSIFHFLEKDM